MAQYFNYKRFETINEDTQSLVTECTSITFDNRGEVAVILYTDQTEMEVKPGETISHNNQPGVMEVTFYEKVAFDPAGSGTKKLFITREFVVSERPTTIYQGPNQE